jgi:streptogrisin C
VLRFSLRSFVLPLVGLAAAATAQPPAVVQPTASVQSSDEALAQDGADYAKRYGVTLDEAVQRLRAQGETVEATDRLEKRFAKRLAGMWIEHAPAYRIVVLLTGSKPVPDETIVAGGLAVPIAFHTGAPATRKAILKAIGKHGGEIRAAFPEARGMGADPRTGALVVMLSQGDKAAADPAAVATRIADLAGVPARIALIERPEANLGVQGGARVVGNDAVTGRRSVCTLGFVVTDGTRSGVVTAAHCPDVLTYVDPGGAATELPFVGQWGWSFQDVQVNEAAATQGPLFYADAKKVMARVPEGQRARASTRAGDFVCHRGERTGYSCGEVELTDYAPPGALCGGPCAPDWVTVRGADCGGGDSGGPVFSGDVAFGIMKGGAWDNAGKCAYYYYMSLDYLPKGWSLVTRNEAMVLPGTRRETSQGLVGGARSEPARQLVQKS